MYTTDIRLNGKYLDKHLMMESLAIEGYNFINEAKDYHDLLRNADSMILSRVDEAIRKGQNLSFEQSFSGMLLVLSATNNHIRTEIFPKRIFPMMERSV